MINFLNQPDVLGLTFEEAGWHLANFYWGGALLGRILGTLLLTRMRAGSLLATCGLTAALLCLIVVAFDGPIAGYAALAIGFFNSIMFPTIFTITLERSGVSKSSTSGLLCLAIFGGAVLPMTVGALADAFGLTTSFIVPLVAYIFIASFALCARSKSKTAGQSDIVGSPVH
jgi:FHS family L-fucose permease-like MFS transporter